jgi:hypothetical protein
VQACRRCPSDDFARRMPRSRHHRLRAFAAATDLEIDERLSVLVLEWEICLRFRIITDVKIMGLALAGSAVHLISWRQEMLFQQQRLGAVEVNVNTATAFLSQSSADVEVRAVEEARHVGAIDNEVLPIPDDRIFLAGQKAAVA